MPHWEHGRPRATLIIDATHAMLELPTRSGRRLITVDVLQIEDLIELLIETRAKMRPAPIGLVVNGQLDRWRATLLGG